MLYGSSVLPSVIIVGTKSLTLGDIVARSYAKSKLTIDEWNNLPELTREFELIKTIYEMRSAENKK